MKRRWAAYVLLLLVTAGCATWPADRMERCAGPEMPAVTQVAPGRVGTTFSVLIYNVEGLPWPARHKRGPWLDRIGDELARLRTAGRAPDIVLMQEAFTPRAARIAHRAGYTNAVRGPGVRDVGRQTTASRGFVAQRRRKKGEVGLKLLGSGLYVMSDLPVEQVFRTGYARYSCAGYDCLSAKGIMLVRVRLPGAPTPIDIATTHMNAGGASGVSRERAGEAHAYQAIEAAEFLDSVRDPANPFILGGDFNMRRNPARFDFFTTRHPYEIVHRRCQADRGSCNVLLSWDGDEPWMDTQDLQAFASGALIQVEPTQVQALFDGPQTGGKLSDHDGFMVTYRLSWPAGAPPLPAVCGNASSVL